VLDSKIILDANDYDYYSFIEETIKPEIVDIRFKDLIPEFSEIEIGDKNLYKHQYASYEALVKGKNLILRSGTGSGKTEAWLIYSIKHKVPTLAIYPTLALANDQIKRIDLYSEKTNLRSLALDANKREVLIHEYGRAKLRGIITQLDLLVTNPALLMNEIKKLLKGKPALISGFLNKVKLVMIDEIDFYSPREIALLLGLIDLMRNFTNSNFQIATLSAMIENPEDLASFYTKLNGRETEIIEGKRFRVENRTYVVLGKNIKKIWERFKKYKNLIESNIANEDLKAFEDFEYFKRNFYKFYEIAKALKIDLGEIDFDPIDLLSNYVRDKHVTLVFTRSINKAEEVARKLKNVLNGDIAKRVASHHHLIDKEERKRAEEGARSGIVKILISPRTLSQGIDIGTVGRIVHFGLPESLREFYQREGRKGRRLDLNFSETIIIPYGSWDRKLLTRGIEALYQWLQLPIEKIIVNVDNKYRILFEAIMKFQSPRLKKLLNDEEIKLLKELRLVKGDELTDRGLEVERKLQFYEFAPPYGINRILKTGEERIYLPEISHVDLVEKFQPGCFDPSNEAIVVAHNISGGYSRIVSAVIEEEMRWQNLVKKDELLPALEEYEEYKYKWGETPDLIYDYMIGKLSSEVLCVVHPPNGFGKYYKIPNRVYWNIRSSKPRIKVIKDKTLVYYERAKIELPTATYGKYSDYTYGAFYELDPSEDVNSIRIGLAFMMIVLRKKLRIPFETILYDVGKFGDKKFLSLHEPNSAGLIEKLDWIEIKKIIEEYKPEVIDEILFEALDEYTYADFISKNLDWEYAKRYAIKALDYILLKEKLKVKFKDIEVIIPKPSKALKLLALDLIWLPLKEELGRKSGMLALAFYDGEDLNSFGFIVEEGRVRNFEEANKLLTKFIDEEFSLLIYDLKAKKEMLNELYLRSFDFILDSMARADKVKDVKEIITKNLDISLAPLEEIEKFAEIQREVKLSDVIYELSNSQQKISQTKANWRNFTKFLEEKAKKYLEDNCKSIFYMYLIMKEITKESIVK